MWLNHRFVTPPSEVLEPGRKPSGGGGRFEAYGRTDTFPVARNSNMGPLAI